ncbi:hypothetical protein NQ318_008267 [Aromia moschata]|uniref:SAP domain-containing protein n=1 Tax=Aromia moschata TaxID=1265417 RepID=A0AAV8XXY8_9CUCU|nr:hypothetical protein NQ318_008267 [Aromia moschata]
MASRQVFLKDLKVADLKRELEERECETTGKKADLQNRLKEALENEGENSDIFLFEIAGDINSALQSLENKLLENATKMQQELQESSGSLEKNLEEKLLENATQMQQKFEETSGNLRGMEQRLVENSSNLRGMEQNLRGMEQKLIKNMDQKLLESYTTLEKKITENSSCLQKKIGEYVDGKFGEIENKFLEVERKIATLSLGSGEQQQVVNTALKSPGSDIDRLSKPELNNYMEISKICMKPPQFDGKSSWVNYLRQFEAAARANGWSLAEKATALTLALRGDATDILQTLSLEEQEDYHQLVRHLEMRYGQSHLEHVYHSQLKNRYQKSNESLQEFEADIARLVRLAYSSTPENVMERLAVQAFLDGLRDTETRQALTLARPSKLVDALARALEFEAAKQSCRGQAKVRRMEDGVEEGTCNEAEIRRVVEGMLEKRQIRCWNCDTGATRTIIRPDIVGTAARITPTSWRLRTATGDPATIRGETNVTIVIGNVSFEHRALVAEIEDELILGMDIMNTKGFKLDFKNNVLKINGEEIILHRKTEETIRVVLAEDTAVPERSEMILDAHLDGNSCVGNIMMFEPRSHDGEVARGIAVGKALLLTEKTVPVRIMNLNHHPVNLRKGIVLGYCSSVSSVIRKLDTRGNSVGRITGELSNLLSSSSRSLRNSELSFEEFMLLHSNGQKARYGVTREEPRYLFQAPADFCLAHCVAADLRMSRGNALTFKKAFGQLEELRRQRPEVGRVLQITAAEQEKERSVFYLVTKQLSHHKPTYQTVWDTLVELRDVLLSQSISSLAIPKIASGLDGLDWRVIRSMLEVLFRFTGIEILVCCYNPRRSLNEKTVDCFFYQTSRCKNGPFCRYRHRPGDDTIRDEMSLRRGQCYGFRRGVPLAVDFAGRVPDTYANLFFVINS